MGELPYGARASMEPFGVDLRYREADSGDSCYERLPVPGSFEDDVLAFEASFDGEVVGLSLTVKEPIVLESAQVRLRHAFASDELVLMNGYQSWTDTAERPAWSRMRGLRGVPRGVVDRWALDGSGDYAHVAYSGRRGQQHGFTYATFARGEGMVLVGSLCEDDGFTLICADAATGEVTISQEPPLRVLQPGEVLDVGRFAIVRGTRDECYGRWRDISAWHARPVAPLVGYTSWYRHYGEIDEQALAADLSGVAAAFDSLGEAALAGKATKLFQIDDGYCKVGDWHEVDARKFPRGLGALAAQVREAGFLPGIWVAPFVCERGSRLFAERPEWLLRDAQGNPVPTGSHWSGGVALDTRNVEVRSYVLDVLQTMVGEWGFGLFKFDFLYAACMIPHDGLNRGQLMADALDLLRRGVGEEALILGCGVPLGSAFGRVDYCRIGCDVGLDWDDAPPMRLLQRERVSTKNSLGNTYARAPLDGRAFGNDPDVFFLRDDVRLTQAQRDELLFADADLGSVLLTSDDMGKWTPAMRERYRAALEIFIAGHE